MATILPTALQWSKSFSGGVYRLPHARSVPWGARSSQGHSTDSIFARSQMSRNLTFDLTGKRFGFWSVVRRDGVKNGHPAWLCVCDCGTETRVTSQHLRRGRSRGCVACRPRSVKYDLTGQRFGRWSVVRRDGATNAYPLWLCVCDCGTEKRVPTQHLTHGRSKGCRQCHDAKAKRIRVGSRELTVAEWAKKVGVPERTIYARLRAGLSPLEPPTQERSAPPTPDEAVHPDTLRLRRAFRKSGLTFEQVAERLGCTRQSVWMAMSVTKKVRQTSLKRFLEAIR